MDNEEVHYLLDSSYFDELHEFSSESAFSYHKEDSISPNILQYDGILDDDYKERLLQMEAELMNIDPINPETIIGGASIEEGIELNHEKEADVDVLIDLAGSSQWKGVLEEVLMEGSSLTDLLLTGAEAVEAENWPLATTVISKLNHILIDQENGDDPFNRLALFFTQGLHFKIINGAPQVSLLQSEPFCTRQTANTMSAFQILQELSPYVKFAHFTANQAILEATQGDQEIHVIDFDIMEGIQWPPLMVDLALRKDASLRITAVIIGHQQNSVVVVQQTERRLREFADSINLPFVFDQMVMVREEDFERIEVVGSHRVIANCMIHQFHMPNRSFSMIKTFLGGVTKLSPKIVALVEEELFSCARLPSMMTFVDFFCEAIHHYTALSESLIMSSFCDGYKMGISIIEKEVLGIKILDSLREFPSEKKELWGKKLSLLKGFQPIPMSFCNVSQARFLASLFSVGYWVQHEKCMLSLCWKSRPLTTASIWVPIHNSLKPG